MTTLAVFASTGAALAACPSQTVSTPFSQFGDTNNYFLVPGGSFDGTSPWNLSNASLTSGGAPAGSTSQSLTINAGGSATSQFICVDNTMPSFRFFANEAASGSDLKIEGVVKTSWGSYTVPVADLADGSVGNAWAPVAPISIGTAQIPVGTTVQAAVRFSVPQGSGSWQIDDVYVDPYRVG
ncbi:MAG: hypothetical protein WBQ18_14460 [Solirubrobacteraceae bacterium]